MQRIATNSVRNKEGSFVSKLEVTQKLANELKKFDFPIVFNNPGNWELRKTYIEQDDRVGFFLVFRIQGRRRKKW